MNSPLRLIFACTCLLPLASAGGIQLGSIQGQDGWSSPVGAAVDQEVTNAAAYDGSQSFRVSNKGNNGSFGDWIFSPGLGSASGQPSSGAPADSFSMSFYFRSVSAIPDGSNLEFDLGNTQGTTRNNFTAVTSYAAGGGGLTLRVAEPDSTGNFYPTNLMVPGLSLTDWHRLDIVATFLDGNANDFFQVFLDDPGHASPIGSPNTSLNHWATFESYMAALSIPYDQSNRLFIRSGAAASAFGSFTDSAAGGFYIDNVSYQSWNSSDPGTILSSYSTGFEDLSQAPEPSSVYLFAAGLAAVACGRFRRR